MTKRALTDKTLKALKPAPVGGRYEIMDAVVPGLGVRVTPKGQRSFILVARYPGSANPTRRTLGEYGVLTLEQARTKARRWLELLTKAIDPKDEEEQKRRQEQKRRANTFELVAEAFIVDHVLKKRKGEEVARDIRREFVSRWGGRPVSDVTRSDVIELINEVKRRAPYQARNLLGYAKTLFDWTIEQDIYGLEASPCDRIRPGRLIGEKVPRQRVLSDQELRQVWAAAKQAGYAVGPIVQLLLLTAARKSEVAEARWSEFDFAKKLWTIPPERTKTDTAHVIPLAPEAIEILETLPRWTRGDYIFSTTCGANPVNGFSKAKDRMNRIIREGMGAAMADWRFHDLRRTARTHFSAIPAQDIVRELAIGHTKPGLHKVYDQHLYLAEKRDLLDRWARRLWAIVEPPPANVITLARA